MIGKLLWIKQTPVLHLIVPQGSFPICPYVQCTRGTISWWWSDHELLKCMTPACLKMVKNRGVWTRTPKSSHQTPARYKWINKTLHIHTHTQTLTFLLSCLIVVFNRHRNGWTQTVNLDSRSRYFLDNFSIFHFAKSNLNEAFPILPEWPAFIHMYKGGVCVCLLPQGCSTSN